jgi:tetratricopeptide (TPR) repeat protein
MSNRTMKALVVLAALAAAGSSARAAEPEKPMDLSIWSDPTFQREFLGSYGFQAEIEPKLSAIERQQLEKVIPLLGSDPNAAAAQIEKVLTDQSSALFDYTLGNIAFQQGDMAKAATHYEAAIRKFPSFRRAHKNLGLIHVREGRFQEALKPLSRVIELGGGDGTVFGLLAYSYAATGQDTSAESAYRTALLLQPDVLDWKTGMAQSVLRQRKYAEASTLAEELIRRNPDKAEYWLMQANAWIGLKEPMKAAENFEIVHRMGKANAAVLQTLGDIYTNESMWELASRAYSAALEKDPAQGIDRPLRNVEVMAQRGAITASRALLAKVKEQYAGQASDDDRRRILKLEARIAMAGGDSTAAVAALEEAVALDPLDGEALMLLGQHYGKNHDPDKAIFFFERAESLEAYEADARVRHAQILVNQSKPQEAVPLLKRAQEIKPREEIARYLEQVERAARAGN